MRIVMTPSDLAFFESAPETLLMTIEPATECNGVACHAPGAPRRSAGLHLHLKLAAPDQRVLRIQFVEIEG